MTYTSYYTTRYLKHVHEPVCVRSVKRVCEEREQKVSLLEENLASAQKEVSDLRSCLREVERSRLEARRELQELRRQVSRMMI